MAEIRLPNINGATEKEQLSQIKNYLYQLTGQLNFALKNMGSESSKNVTYLPNKNNSTTTPVDETEERIRQFNELKNLIIKSADIVEAYSEIIEYKLSGNYVAISDFGTYKEETEAFHSETSKNMTTTYSSIKTIESGLKDVETGIQTIEDELGNLNGIRKDNCYIKTGWLDDDNTIAGVEVGKFSEFNGETIDNAFARFTTDELAFYNQNGDKLGWFGQHTMYIMNAQIEQNLYLGGYVCDTTNGIAFKWVGRN